MDNSDFSKPETFIEAIGQHERLLTFYEIWAGARTAPNLVPRKSDLDVVALGMAGLMPSLWVVEATAWPLAESTFRYRLVGEDIVQGFKNNPTRATLAEVHDAELSTFLHRRYRLIMEQALAEYRSGRILQADKKTFIGHRVLLPLADDDSKCVFTIGCMQMDETIYHLTASKRPKVSANDIIATPIDHLPL